MGLSHRISAAAPIYGFIEVYNNSGTRLPMHKSILYGTTDAAVIFLS